jgi:hypothetical protein
MSDLMCIVCGKVLASPLDQYGPSESVRCWQCISKGNATKEDKTIAMALTELQDAVNLETGISEMMARAEAKHREAKTKLKKLYGTHPWLELRVSEIETRYG